MIQNAFRTVTIPREVNRTFIVLIPKASQISTFNHRRPISLCNTVYKILSKIITDRLRHVIDKLVSPFQAAFIPSRWIGENSILVNEILHTMKKSRSGTSLVGIKLYMLKAYNCMDWGMLTRILSKFGFSHRMVDLVLRCITPETVGLLLNGSVFSKVKGERGLR